MAILQEVLAGEDLPANVTPHLWSSTKNLVEPQTNNVHSVTLRIKTEVPKDAPLDHTCMLSLPPLSQSFKMIRVANTPINMGTCGTSYKRRAFVALGGLGCNLPEDVIYPTAFVDGMGQPLTGANKYVLHFEKGQLPPANAFWSITMYDKERFQIPNSLDRFAVASHDKLKFNDDGSLDIYVQAESPGKGKESNWLLTPKGSFEPRMRLYSPRPEALDLIWSPPPFIRVE